MSGSLTVSAKPPLKSTVYANVYGTIDPAAWQSLSIIPVTNYIFGLKPSVDLTACTNLRLYFGMGVDSIQSFHIKIRRLSDWVEDSSTALNASGLSIDLALFNQYGTQTGYTSVRSQTQVDRAVGLDGFTYYEWTWAGSNAVANRNAVTVTIPFQSFVLGTNKPLYFEVVDVSVNGEATVFSAYESESLQHLQNIDDAITGDPNPNFTENDLPTVPDGTQISNQASSSVSVIDFFTNYFDVGGAMQRTLGQFSDQFLVVNANDSLGHKVITYSCLFSLAAVFIIWLVNQLKRYHGGGDG